MAELVASGNFADNATESGPKQLTVIPIETAVKKKQAITISQ